MDTGSEAPTFFQRIFMRFIGIDIASEDHVFAVVDEQGKVQVKATKFREDAQGYEAFFAKLGDPKDALVAMEATGHYWQNLFAVLAARGFSIALLNPLRTSRFAAEDLARAKTDALDAVAIARFAAQKRPTPAPVPDVALNELRELVRLRDRLVQDFGDRQRQLHRSLDLGFPEFTRFVKDVGSELATAILSRYPTAAALHGVSLDELSRLVYDGRHKVGPELARQLLEAARTSVGQHHGKPYQLQVRYACEDLDVLRRRLKSCDKDITGKLAEHEVGTLLTTIDGIGPLTAARLVAELGDPSAFRSAGALAAHVGVVPGIRHSGKRTPVRAALAPHGDARLRAKLWMPTLRATRSNPWLKAFYDRLRAAGKLPKVALVAAMHKLLGAVYSVAKNRRPFTPQLAAVAVPG